MVILRCTQKLHRRLPDVGESGDVASTTVFGDWTCNLARFGRIQTILCVSHVTLLPVLVPARLGHTFPGRLQTALAQMLAILSVPAAQIAQEIAAMDEHVIAATNNRQVLGSLNDFKRMAEFFVQSADLDELLTVSLQLAKAPCKPINYLSPQQAVAQAFA